MYFGLVVMAKDGNWVHQYAIFSTNAKRQQAADAYKSLGFKTCNNDDPMQVDPEVELIPPQEGKVRFTDYTGTYTSTGDGEVD